MSVDEPTTPATIRTPRLRTSAAPGRIARSGATTGDPVAEVVVAVAVITCDLGVLLGQRRDQHPAWTFPGGKIEGRRSRSGGCRSFAWLVVGRYLVVRTYG
jgi:hypothetical protein